MCIMIKIFERHIVHDQRNCQLIYIDMYRVRTTCGTIIKTWDDDLNGYSRLLTLDLEHSS